MFLCSQAQDYGRRSIAATERLPANAEVPVLPNFLQLQSPATKRVVTQWKRFMLIRRLIRAVQRSALHAVLIEIKMSILLVVFVQDIARLTRVAGKCESSKLSVIAISQIQVCLIQCRLPHWCLARVFDYALHCRTRALYRRTCLNRHRSSRSIRCFFGGRDRIPIFVYISVRQFVTSFYPLEAFCSAYTSFAVSFAFDVQSAVVRVGIQTN